MTSPEVLIAGAGPSGLVLAIDLARRGVAVRIFDQAPGPSPASRAKGLQPRTLEIFHDLGIAGQVLAGGGPFPRWRSYSGAELRWERSIWELLGIAEPAARPDRPYPETWMIPQFRTEAILRERLAEFGVWVEFGTAFVSCEQDEDGVKVTLKGPDGSSSVSRCRYLVGADGGRSTVRKALGIAFEGETREDERYLIADVEATGLDPRYWHNWSPAGDAVRRISMCPLPGTDSFQLVAPLEPGAPAPELTLATLQGLVDGRTGAEVALAGLSWITLHRTNLRLAASYRQGSVFLVGDAAHSPPQAGGQGLNISVQDAWNLGWKLGATLRGATPALLDSYESERRPFAAGKLGRLAAELEAHGLPTAEAEARQKEIQQDLFHLDLGYRESPIVREARRHPPAGVRAGDRAPDAAIAIEPGGEPMRLLDLFRGPQSTLLAFSPATADLCADLVESHREFIRLCLVHPLEGRDPVASIHEVYGIEAGSSALLLIRPDGYVGLAADENPRAELMAYLAATTPVSRT